jgi:hypothetical protein
MTSSQPPRSAPAPQPEPPACALCRSPVHTETESHIAQPVCGHHMHLVCARRMDYMRLSKCPACPELALSHGAALAQDGYSTDPGHDADVRHAIMHALDCADLQAGDRARCARAPRLTCAF